MAHTPKHTKKAGDARRRRIAERLMERYGGKRKDEDDKDGLTGSSTDLGPTT